MNTLWFVRFANRDPMSTSDVVFCLTADSAEHAEQLGFALIADAYRAEYRLTRVEAVCQTPDVVTDFEPC